MRNSKCALCATPSVTRIKQTSIDCNQWGYYIRVSGAEPEKRTVDCARAGKETTDPLGEGFIGSKREKIWKILEQR